MHLTLLHDPAGITGRHLKALDPAATLQANIERILPAGGGDVELRINGARVDPLTDARLDAPPRAGDAIVLVCRPAGFDPITWTLIAVAALTVYTYTQLPKIPGLPTQKDSPNNALTAQTNVARAYQAIPDVYGYRRVWPDLIQPAVVEYIDNLRHITEWLCVSRGTGDITEVRYADTDFDEIGGASWQAFYPATTPSAYPELNDTTLTDVVEAFRSPQVDNVELNIDVPTSDYIERYGSVVTALADTKIDFTFVDGPVWDFLKTQVGVASVEIQLLPGYSNAYFPATLPLLSYTTSGGNVTFRFDNTTLNYADGPFSATFLLLGSTTPTSVTKGPYVLPADGDGIQFNIIFLRGLKWSVDIDVAWEQVDADGDPIPGTDETATYNFTADTFDQRFYTRKITPAAGLGRYRISFERTSASTGNGDDVATLEAVWATRTYATKVLPGVTVIRVQTKATDNSAGTPERKFNCRFARHVRTLTTTTLGASRNFARALAHLWCVAGEDIAQLDTAALAAINTALGESSALLRFDGSLDDADTSLGERMQRISDAARCVLWRSGTKWTVTRDEARAFPELQLDYRNLAASGDSTISYAAHLPASYDGIEVEYTDETTQAKKAYVRLSIASGAVTVATSSNPLKIKMPGCATTAQAENRAHLEARRLLYSRTSVQDVALADAGQLGVGSLVRWVDPNDFAGDDGLQAGEVLAIDSGTDTLTTSEPLDWKSEVTGRILLTGVDGLYLGTPIVCTPGATANQVVLSSAVPVGAFVRSATRQLGSRYAFAVGLTEAEMQASGLFVVTETAPASDRTVSIALAQYDARMYEED